MSSGVTAVLLLSSVGYICGGSQVPITSYVCTQPTGTTDNDQCNVNNGLRKCEITNGVPPTLLDGNAPALYGWALNTTPFVVLDLPQGWCVGSVQMGFNTAEGRKTPSINVSVHSMSQLSNNGHDVQAMYPGGTQDTSVVLNLTSLTCGRYLRIDMSGTTPVLLTEISVFDTTADISITGPPTAATDNVLPAAISSVVVLLLLVLIVIFVIVICIIARRHNSWKSLAIHHLSLRRQSNDTFKDDQQCVVVQQENTQVASHDANSAVSETNNNGEIGDAVYTYATVGPAEFNDHFAQDAVEEPVAECDHLYSAVDKSCKKSATAGMPPSAGGVHTIDGTHVYDEVDMWSKEDEKSDNVCGGSGNVEGDFMVELQDITSADTDRGAVPTEAVVMDTMYAQVDYSKKKSKKT